MVEKTKYAPGTPSWIDIGTDLDAAKQFYPSLFGWGTQDAGPPEETGGYGFFTKNDKLVTGYGPQQSPGPPSWMVYFAVEDADATTKKVEAAGGTVVVAPMDVMTAGRMAVYQDPQGAFFSVWQPGETAGAQLVDEVGALCWTELSTRDVDGAKTFYSAVFGWEPQTHGDGPMPYTEWQLGGTTVGGMMDMPPMVPKEVPPYWLVYFGVDDPDAAAQKAASLGGSVLVAGMDFPGGRFAVVADPQGATFGLLRLTEQPG